MAADDRAATEATIVAEPRRLLRLGLLVCWSQVGYGPERDQPASGVAEESMSIERCEMAATQLSMWRACGEKATFNRSTGDSHAKVWGFPAAWEWLVAGLTAFRGIVF